MENVLNQTYSQAAVLARQAETLEQEAEVWRSIMQLHDLPVDYRIAATERLSLVNRAIYRHSLPMPAGLFPQTT